MTLDDLLRPLYILLHYVCVFRRPSQEFEYHTVNGKNVAKILLLVFYATYPGSLSQQITAQTLIISPKL